MSALYTESKDYVVCPWCKGKSGGYVGHLYDQKHPFSFGTWYCDECHRGFTGVVNAPGDVTVKRSGTDEPKWLRSMSLLKLDGKSGPVFFIIDDQRPANQSDETDEDNQNHRRYFFEEHSCPTNWLRNVAAVIENGDADPHGFLTFVRSVDVPDDFDDDHDQMWPMLFPEAFGGAIIEGEAMPSVRRISQEN